MKRLARYLRRNGLQLLGGAFEAFRTGGVSLIPKFVKQVTKTLGLPDTASEQEILAQIMGNDDHLERLREIQAESKKADIEADLTAYLAELDFDKERVSQAGQTNREDVKSESPYVYRARPWGLYTTVRFVLGIGVVTVLIAIYSFYQEKQMLALCIDAKCFQIVADFETPIEVWLKLLKSLPTLFWAVVSAPSISYYPVRTADKWINKWSPKT